jgi:hypothetical protein
MGRGLAKFVIAAFVLVSALTACGGGGSSSGSGVAAKSPDEIVAATQNAVANASSVHVAGSIISGGVPLKLDLRLASGQGAAGEIAQNGASFRIIAINDSVYIKGSPGFWRRFGGAVASRLLDGKWLKAPLSGQFGSFAPLTDMQIFFSRLLSGHGALVKGATKSVNGQQAIGLTDTTKGGTLYVATSGKPYPVELTKQGAEGGKITFDRFNEPISLTAPSNVLDVSHLG